MPGGGLMADELATVRDPLCPFCNRRTPHRRVAYSLRDGLEVSCQVCHQVHRVTLEPSLLQATRRSSETYCPRCGRRGFRYCDENEQACHDSGGHCEVCGHVS